MSERTELSGKPASDTHGPQEKGSCPKCNIGTLRSSRQRWYDRFAAWIGWRPYRCSRCNYRTYRK